MLYNVLLIIQIAVSVAIIVLILMQHGKGADAGAAFGSGASGTVFGAQGASNFLSRTTAILAAIFFTNALFLGFLVSGKTIKTGSSIMDAMTPPAKVETAPAAVSVVVPPKGDVPAVPGQGAADASAQKPITSDVPPPAAPAGDKPAASPEPANASEPDPVKKDEVSGVNKHSMGEKGVHGKKQ